MLNPWQRIVANEYADGDYRHVETLDECREVGDGLFTFLMIELDEGEGCDSWDEAVRRVDVAIQQLDQMSTKIALAEPEPGLGFDEDHSVGPSREGGSIKRSHRAEGRNWVD